MMPRMSDVPTSVSTPGPRHFLFLVASARISGVVGNTEWLARQAATHLPAGATATWLAVRDLQLPWFDDRRHDVGTYPPPEGDAKTLLDATLAATDLVIVTPTYWYGVPARLKLAIDHWSAWMRVPGLDFKARMAGRHFWVVTTSGNRAKTQPMIDALALCADFLSMRWHGALWGLGGPPGAVEQDAAAIVAAATFFDESTASTV
jgi:NAD(P)H-dependent FMN reductase